MSIALAMALAMAETGKADTAIAHGKAFTTALLAEKAPVRPPYAAPRIKYDAWRNPTVQRKLPVIADSLAGFRKALRGCTIDQVQFGAAMPDVPKSYDSVGISFDCPENFAHANGELFLDLRIVNGLVVEARMQIGLGPAPAPPAMLG